MKMTSCTKGQVWERFLGLHFDGDVRPVLGSGDVESSELKVESESFVQQREL
jgi:hypothetical protein